MHMKRQQGLSLISVIIVGGLAAFALVIGFRTVPAINEYLSVQRIVKIIADEGDAGASLVELRRSFDRRGYIDQVTTVSGVDLVITKPGGKTLVEVEYARKVPVIANVSLLIDFSASSAAR